MKKTNVLSIALGIVVMLMSCNKAEVYQAVSKSQSIAQNQSYTFELPATDDPYKVLTEAKNASVSLIGVNAAGNPIYTYTPTKDFIGTDKVVLQTTDNEGTKGPDHGGHGRNHNDLLSNVAGAHTCNKGVHTEDDYTVTIDIIVTPTPI